VAGAKKNFRVYNHQRWLSDQPKGISEVITGRIFQIAADGGLQKVLS
jgi:hypothetical protein